ncbi:MAG: hypothetical protein ACXWFI_12875 [Methylobacter sp.]
MNIAIGIVSGLGVLLATLFILKKRKACSSCSSHETPVNNTKPSDQEKPEIKPVANTAVNAEATTVNPQITDAVSSTSPTTTVNPQITDAAVSSSPASVNKPVSNVEISAKPQEANSSSEFPEDSILKRHYLHHVCSMVEAIAPQSPEESVLRRHHYAVLIGQIEECIKDTKAAGRLINDYEQLKA